MVTKIEKWTERMNIPLARESDLVFQCANCDTIVAINYLRVVIGDRGPYIEFDSTHISWDAFDFPEDQQHVYFDEFRSRCGHNIMLYSQRRTVQYADYKIGLIYIGPNLVRTDVVCIEPLPKPKKSKAFF